MKLKTEFMKILTALGVAIVLGVAKFATPFMTLATIAYFLLVAGVFNRKNRFVHSRLMTSGIILDLCVVLTLQFQRHAIQTALKFSLTALQQAHIAASGSATVLYIPTLILGWTLFRNPQKSHELRKWHLRVGVAAFVFRTAGFFLMFSMLDKH